MVYGNVILYALHSEHLLGDVFCDFPLIIGNDEATYTARLQRAFEKR